MEYFVQEHSIVRRIWGKSDTILFIFAGAAAEFALNKAVDWLYFTGRLPADPIGRLFSTVSYARRIIFAEKQQALKAIDTIAAIHSGVEANRGAKIPDWAYRDVLYMLIHYSISAFELLERKLEPREKQDLFAVFHAVGVRMGLKDLPPDFVSWLPDRKRHLDADLEKSKYTTDLFLQYKKHLGDFRYWILVESQKKVVPPEVSKLLGFSSFSWLTPIVPVYRFSRVFRLDYLVKELLLPATYKKQIRDLDIVTK